MKAHLDEQFDLIRRLSKGVQRLPLAEYASAAARIRFRGKLDAVKRRDDVNPVDRGLGHAHAVGRVESGALGLDPGLADVDRFLDGPPIERQLNGAGSR